MTVDREVGAKEAVFAFEGVAETGGGEFATAFPWAEEGVTPCL